MLRRLATIATVLLLSLTAADAQFNPGVPSGGGSGGGGGGGAATIADGADVAEGSTTDAATAAGAAGTVSAKLRTLTGQLGGSGLIGIGPNNTAAAAITPIPSTAPEASRVFKASAGNLYSAYAFNTTATAGWCLLINATTAPASGSAVAPLDFAPLPASGGCAINFGSGPPNRYSTGIVMLVSSNTSPFVYTSGVITAVLSGRVQ